MRWQGQRESDNVDDRRGQSPRRIGGGLPLKGKTGVVLFLVVMVAGYYGVDLTPLLDTQGGAVLGQHDTERKASPEEDEMARFTSVVLASTENTWQQKFNQMGKRYKEPTLVLFTGRTNTACGLGQAAMGPFYCPGDEKLYIDLSFYYDMKRNLGGGGDFAQGYVVAHEVGHHVQHLLGINEKVREQQRRVSKVEANKLLVRMELQADCLAGIWGNQVKNQNLLEVGDLEEALNTAQAIGDDRLQKQATGTVVPDSFTHGTSEQRYYWFKRGFDQGTLAACDTFNSLP